jgi:type IV secretory pathway VirB3-like protein
MIHTILHALTFLAVSTALTVLIVIAFLAMAKAICEDNKYD